MSRLIPRFPNEVFLEIVEHLLADAVGRAQVSGWQSMNGAVSFASTSRAIHQFVTPLIYRHAAEHSPALFFWACDRGHARLVEELITAGFEPNCPLVSKDRNATGLVAANPGHRPAQAFECFDGPRLTWVMSRSPGGGHAVMDVPHSTAREAGDYEIQQPEDLNHTHTVCLSVLPSQDSLYRDNVQLPLMAYPIHFAALAGKADVVETLMGAGAFVDIPAIGLHNSVQLIDGLRHAHETLRWNTLHFAIVSQDLRTITLILNWILDVCPKSIFTEKTRKITAIHSAAAVGNESVIDLVLRMLEPASNNPSLAGLDDTYSLFSASPINFPDKYGFSPIQYAHRQGNFATMEHLLGLGADVDGGYETSYTPLLAACAQGHTEMAQNLIAYGADVNAICGAEVEGEDIELEGLRPLDICCRYRLPGRAVLVASLLGAGAQIYHRLGRGYTDDDPVTTAAATHQSKVLRQLLEAGGQANKVKPRSSLGTPLNATIMYCSMSSSLGRHHHKGRKRSITGSMMIFESSATEMISADTSVQSEGAVQQATSQMLECISTLLSYGADPYARDCTDMNSFRRLCQAYNSQKVRCSRDDTDHDVGGICRQGPMEEKTAVKVAQLLSSSLSGFKPDRSFLHLAFVHTSPLFCKAMIQSGAQLLEGANELRDLFDRLLDSYTEIPRNKRTKVYMIQRRDPESCLEAVSLLAEMDTQGRLWRDPYFLSKAMAAQTELPELMCVYLIEFYREELSKLVESRQDFHGFLLCALRSGRLSKVRAVLSLYPKDPTLFRETRGLTLLAEATRTVSGGDKWDILDSLLNHGFEVHWASAIQDPGGRGRAGDGPEAVHANHESNPSCTSLCRAWESAPVRNGAMCYAIRKDNWWVLDVLLNHTPITKRVPPEYQAAYLREACESLSIHVLKVLLAWGADPGARNPETGETALLQLLHRMDQATESCLAVDYGNDLRASSKAPAQWIRKWVACVTILLRQQGAFLQPGINGVTVAEYIVRVLEYSGSKWFRIYLRHQARKKWRLVQESEGGCSADRRIEVGEISDEDIHNLWGTPHPTYIQLMYLRGAASRSELY